MMAAGGPKPAHDEPSPEVRQIFISYAREDDEPFVKRLHADLTDQGYRIWWDREAMESRGRTFLQEIRDGIASSERLILVVGPRAVESDYVRIEWHFALQACTVVLPILRVGNSQMGDDDYKLVPAELRSLHCPDFRPSRSYDDALAELLRLLDTPLPPLGVLHGVHALPANYLPRPSEIERLEQLVLADVSSPVVITSARQTTALQGMGGLGKSVLAAAFARSCKIRRSFGDGVVWVTLGPEPNLAAALRVVGTAFRDDWEYYTDLPGSASRLADILAGRNCLLVLDDVWDATHAETFLNAAGPRCRLLVTTRDTDVVQSLGALPLALDVLGEEQALALLAGWAGQDARNLPAEAAEVARECGFLPLALAMGGAMAAGAPSRWLHVLHRLRTADLARIRRQFPNYPYPDLLRAIQVSVDALDPADRERYLQLAVFPKGVSVPDAALKVLWERLGIDQYDAQDTIDRLVSRSVLRRADEHTVSLHDLHHDFLIAQTPDAARLHNQLIEGYGAHCADGWPTGPEDGYFFQNIDYHFKAAGRAEELRRLLLDFSWIRAKVNATHIADLIDDYNAFLSDEPLRTVQQALRLSAHSVSRDKGQLPSQLYGRLLQIERAEIRQLVAQIRQWQGDVWLRPLTRDLIAPGGAVALTLEGHIDAVRSVAVTANGRFAVSASADHTLRLWDLATGRTTKTLVGHRQAVNRVSVDRDGRLAISAGFDMEAKVWDLRTGKIKWALQGSNCSDGVALSGDGQVAVTTAYYPQVITVWDMQSGTPVLTLEGDSGGVRQVAIDQCGRTAITASNDSTLKLWDVRTGKATGILKGHADAVSSVAINGDGRAVSASTDGTVKVWNLQ